MYSLRRYDWILHLIAIASCAYFLARGVTTYVSEILESIQRPSVSATAQGGKNSPDASTASKSENLDDYKIVLDRNIFNSTEVAVAKETTPEETTDQANLLGPAVKTTLDIKL